MKHSLWSKPAFIFALMVLALVIVFAFACKDYVPDQAGLAEPAPIDLSADPPMEIQVPYSQIVAQATSKPTPMSTIPGLIIQIKDKSTIDVSKLPPNVDYKDLSKYATPSTGGSGCSGGTHTCQLTCNLKYRYIITGIPDECSCYNYDGGMDIWCPNCPSYSLTCQRRSS